MHYPHLSTFVVTWCSPCVIGVGPTFVVYDLILIWLYLQNSYFQIQSHSQAPGVRTSAYLLEREVTQLNPHSPMGWNLPKVPFYASSWFYSSLSNTKVISVSQFQLFDLESISKLSSVREKFLIKYLFLSRKCKYYIESELLFCFNGSIFCLTLVNLKFHHYSWKFWYKVTGINANIVIFIIYFTGLESLWTINRIKTTLAIKAFLCLLSLSSFSWGWWWYRRMLYKWVYLCSIHNFNKMSTL